jgi:hypothetical protein
MLEGYNTIQHYLPQTGKIEYSQQKRGSSLLTG